MRLACLAFALLVAACDPSWPGASVGAYRVTATASTNDCGPVAVDARPVTFDVELRRDDGLAYWRRKGLPVVGGGYDVSGAFAFHTQNEIARAGGVDGGAPTCILVQDEMIHGTSTATETPDGGALDAGTLPDGGAPTVLTGTDDVTFGSYPSGDCSVLLTANGGAFRTLPCTVHYDLVGVPVDPFQ